MTKRYVLNKNLAQMLKGALLWTLQRQKKLKITEEAGACAVMAL